MKDITFVIGGYIVCLTVLSRTRPGGIRSWGINVTIAPRLVQEQE